MSRWKAKTLLVQRLGGAFLQCPCKMPGTSPPHLMALLTINYTAEYLLKQIKCSSLWYHKLYIWNIRCQFTRHKFEFLIFATPDLYVKETILRFLEKSVELSMGDIETQQTQRNRKMKSPEERRFKKQSLYLVPAREGSLPSERLWCPNARKTIKMTYI